MNNCKLQLTSHLKTLLLLIPFTSFLVGCQESRVDRLLLKDQKSKSEVLSEKYSKENILGPYYSMPLESCTSQFIEIRDQEKSKIKVSYFFDNSLFKVKLTQALSETTLSFKPENDFEQTKKIEFNSDFHLKIQFKAFVDKENGEAKFYVHFAMRPFEESEYTFKPTIANALYIKMASESQPNPVFIKAEINYLKEAYSKQNLSLLSTITPEHFVVWNAKTCE